MTISTFLFHPFVSIFAAMAMILSSVRAAPLRQTRLGNADNLGRQEAIANMTSFLATASANVVEIPLPPSESDPSPQSAIRNLQAPNSFTNISTGLTYNSIVAGAYSDNYGMTDATAAYTFIRHHNSPLAAPVAISDTYTATEYAQLVVPAPGILSNDSDPDGDPLTPILDTDVTNGTLNLYGDGSFEYTTNPGYCGLDSFTYYASDGLSSSNIVTVDITVICVPPTSVSIDGPTEGVTHVGYSFSASVDPVTTTQPITYTWQASGQATVIHPNGSLNNTATFTWTTTGPQAITVTASNALSSVSSTHTITTLQSPTNLILDMTIWPLVVESGDVVTFTLTYSNVSPVLATNVVLTDTLPPGLTPSGIMTWDLGTVLPGEWGAVELTATVDMTSTAYVILTNTAIIATNTPESDYSDNLAQMPIICVNTSPTSVSIDGPTEGPIPVGYSFSASVDPVTTTQPITYIWQASGQATVIHPNGGLNDTVVFTWTTGGRQTITVTASNALSSVSSTHVIYINNAPIAVDDSATTGEGTAVTIDVLANDNDVDGDPVVVGSVIQPANGTVVNNAFDVTYTSDAGYCGDDTFIYIVSDSILTDTATVTVTVTCIPPTSVSIDGPIEGAIQVGYSFSANVDPVTTTQPITYTWQASGQATVIHPNEGLNNTVVFTWTTTGRQAITVTASNALSSVSSTYTITTVVAPPNNVVIHGVTRGIAQADYSFTAMVNPITTSQPITYVWQATGMPEAITYSGDDLNNTLALTWDTLGPKFITVTASNIAGRVTGTHSINILPLNIIAVSAGYFHTCALSDSGGAKCWGLNMFGQLGDGTNNGSNVPVNASVLTSEITAIVVGGYDARDVGSFGGHTCVLTDDGGVQCWGENSYGQLGNGTFTNSPTPVDVVGLTSGVKAVATGDYHTCALTINGGAKCWGSNSFGQLGASTSIDKSNVPVNVTSLNSGVTTIAVGQLHTCALVDTLGGNEDWVFCWGSNGYGQLGDGTTNDGMMGWRSGVVFTTLEAGGWHTCGSNANGAARCWGSNEFGQLGDGTNQDRHVPTDVQGLASGVTAVTTGRTHTCARLDDGGVKCWGSNGDGQLGNNSTTNFNEPSYVSGLMSGIATVTAGADYTCALTNDGRVKCWGNNEFGQLGDGTNTNSSNPVDVILANPTIRKSVTPLDQVNYGDELTYTLIISATPNTQVALYDPLEGTTWLRFVGQEPDGIAHSGNAITGALTIPPTGQITVSFVVEVGIPGTVGWTVSVTNTACVYPIDGTIEDDCIWSNKVVSAAFRPYSIYLPLTLRNH